VSWQNVKVVNTFIFLRYSGIEYTLTGISRLLPVNYLFLAGLRTGRTDKNCILAQNQIAMRYFFVFALLLGASFHLQAQTVDNAQVNAEAEALIKTYQLTESQEAEAYTIAERRLRNQSEIAHLQSSDNKLYLQKKNGIREGEIVSLRRLMNEAQMPVLRAQIVDRRKKESDLIQKMKAQGATREEIQLAIWDME
jgi:hypothetical protein